VRILRAGGEAAALWRIREDGAGLAGRTPRGRQAWPGWEDAAVPPERLGAYLRDFERLMHEHGVHGLPFGHFGDGCIHVRLDIPLDQDGRALRSFVEDSARLVVSHGGSLSGEHGDGRARSGLLPLMYSTEALELQRRFKDLFDPRGLLNPEIVVDPAPVDHGLRRPAALPIRAAGGFAFVEDGGDITAAVHRCVGVGKCRAEIGGFMCPSFTATRDENDVTRGRARTLQEMANGSLVTDGWRSREVHEALDLCLSCKACSSECPAGVDMARYKSEALFRRHRGRLRPMSHYVLGWLPRWSALAGRAPRLVNALASSPVLSRIALRLGGMDVRRGIPAFASRPFRRRPREEPAAPESSGGPGRRVVLWVDSFSDGFSPDAARAAVEVLQRAGCTVAIPEESVCCGLTWISTGQLGGARRRLNRLVDAFAPFVAAGYAIVGLEPSCTAVLRGDLRDLLPESEDAAAIASATMTIAEVLESCPDWQPPDLGGRDVVVQPHCHHHSVMGFDADRRILERAQATVQQLAGCCGLAGNFGMERGHFEVSVAVAEQALLPALRGRSADAVFLADGFSCRTQAEQLAGVRGITLAELLTQHNPNTK
jgi:Fe-S oxidoreductase